MLESLLIANRGEIACRVIRTAKRLGVRTVAIYSDADANALHVQHADQSVCVGPARATESYLDIDKVLAAAACSGKGLENSNEACSTGLQCSNVRFRGKADIPRRW